jgi:hypothetical protein
MLLSTSVPPQDRADQQRDADEHEPSRGQVDEALVGRVGEGGGDDAV